jgi:hypothetical protein
VFDWWSKAIVRKIEIDERATYKDSGCVDLLIERVLAIDEQNADALPREQSGTLQSGQSGADDSYVITRSHRCIAKSSVLQSPKAKKGGEAGRH